MFLEPRKMPSKDFACPRNTAPLLALRPTRIWAWKSWSTVIWLFDYSLAGAGGLPAAVEVARVGGVLSRRLSAQGRGLVKLHRLPRPGAAGKRNISVGLWQGVWVPWDL